MNWCVVQAGVMGTIQFMLIFASMMFMVHIIASIQDKLDRSSDTIWPKVCNFSKKAGNILCAVLMAVLMLSVVYNLAESWYEKHKCGEAHETKNPSSR